MYTPQHWSKLSAQEKDVLRRQHKEISIEHLFTNPEGNDLRRIRTDRKLIKVVEELGDAACSDKAGLKVVEIPDGVKWEIYAPDGVEEIHEIHRIWC